MNTAAADHTTGMMALTERPCARYPAAPKPAAKIAAVVRCSETEPSVALGPMPGNGPPGSTSMSGLPRTAHSKNTMATNRAAKPTAPVAAGARQATNNAPATTIANTIMAASAWKLESTISVAPSRLAASEPDETGSIRPSSAGGPNMNPHTTSNAARINPATTWNKCGPSIEGPHCRQGRVQSSASTMVVTASQRHSLMRASPNAAAVTIAR